MNKHFLASLAFGLLCIGANSCQQSPFEEAEPGATPKVFYPDNVSRNGIQWNNSFAKNGREVFYTIQGPGRAYLVTQEFKGGEYGQVSPLPFDTTALYSDVMVNEAGNHIMFMSTLPHPETGNTDFNLWQSKLVNGSWNKPSPISAATSGAGGEGYPSVAENGNLYFSVARDGSRNSDIYVLRKGTQEAIALPSPINSDRFEGDAYIDPKERFIMFAAFDRPDSQGFSDLYISFYENGQWTEPRNMGINSSGYDGSPYVTNDGKYLLFTSSRNSPGNNSFFNHYILQFDLNDYR